MGADGGTFAQRSEMVRTKNDGGASLVDPMQLARLLWTICRLSREPLAAPVVADDLGRLYNKDAILLHLATRASSSKATAAAAAPRELAHIRRIADLHTLKLAKNPHYKPEEAETLSSSSSSSGYQTPFVCPLSQRPMNGKTRFVFLRTCGCVMAEVALKAVVVGSAGAKEEAAVAGTKRKLSPAAEEGDSASPPLSSDAAQLPCPVCSTPFSPVALTRHTIKAGGDVLLLNPTEAEEQPMRLAMERRHAVQAQEAREKKERKKAAAKKVLAAGEVVDESVEEVEKRAAKEARRAEKARLKAEALTDEPSAKRLRMEATTSESFKPTVSIAGSAAAQLAAQAKTAKQAELSPAMRSLYGLDKPASDGRDTWMTRGTFNRFA